MVAGDLLLDVTQAILKREKLTPSSTAFLFDDEDRILAHPKMSEILGREVSGAIPHLRETDMLSNAIQLAVIVACIPHIAVAPT